jgi:lambda repressor-like predicted transcriptional regulator
MIVLTSEYLLATTKQAIKTKGLTYRELSEKVGMPLSTFKRHFTSTKPYS